MFNLFKSVKTKEKKEAKCTKLIAYRSDSRYFVTMRSFKKSFSLMTSIPLSTLIWSNFSVMADNKRNIDDDIMSEFQSILTMDAQVDNYHKWTHPAKPNKSEVGKFLNFLEMLPRHNRILIIGSSPELRDMAFMTSKNITCCDYSQYTLESMKKFMKYSKYIENEQLIECNPLQMSEHSILSKQKYDLILSVDMRLNMLPFEEWNTFLTQIADRLENDGFFMLKVMNRPNDDFYFLSPTNAEQIVEDWMYSQHKHDVGHLFVNLLLWFYHHPQQNVEGINWKKVIDFVMERCDKWEWSEQQKADFFEKFGCFQENDRIFYCKEEEEMKSMLGDKLFYFQQYCYGDDDAEKYKFTPIYVLGKQSSRTGGQPFVWGHGETKSELEFSTNRERVS